MLMIPAKLQVFLKVLLVLVFPMVSGRRQAAARIVAVYGGLSFLVILVLMIVLRLLSS